MSQEVASDVTSARQIPSVLWSCVAENRPDWCEKVFNLALSVRTFGGRLAQERFVANFVGGVRPEFKSKLAALDVETLAVEPYAAKVPTANKLRILDLGREADVDVLLALDCDMLVTGDVSQHLMVDSVRAVPESRDPFGPEQWRLIFESFAMEEPPQVCVMTGSGRSTYPFYKSGVLSIPTEYCSPLVRHWARYIKMFEDLCERSTAIENRWFADQVGLACAISAGQISFDPFPVAMNFPFRVRVHSGLSDEVRPPFVVHTGNQTDAQGFVLASRNKVINPYIDAFNDRRAEHLGLAYSGLTQPSIPIRLQRVLSGTKWYDSGVVRRLRSSGPARRLRRKVML